MAERIRRSQGLPDQLVHQIAQAMCYAKHGDWRYDPGNPKHAKWFERAKQFAIAARVGHERIGNSDGVGSSPPRATDRPQTYALRFLGGWVNERGEDGR